MNYKLPSDSIQFGKKHENYDTSRNRASPIGCRQVIEATDIAITTKLTHVKKC
jgi:hypothetical protein